MEGQTMQRETRQVDFTVTRSETDDDGLTLEGYAAVFNAPTRIESVREGTFDEVIKPGAFKRSINAKGPAGIRLQFDHGHHPLIGSIPIGAINQIHEDSRGLFVSARLHDNWLTQPVRDAIASGAVSGMSFRFRVPEGGDDWDNSSGVPLRTIRELELFEAGPVVWPAYDATTVGVRSLDGLLDKVRDWADTNEDFRDALRAIVDGPSDTHPTEDGGPVEEHADADGTPDLGPRRNRAEDYQKALSDIDAFLTGRKENAA